MWILSTSSCLGTKSTSAFNSFDAGGRLERSSRPLRFVLGSSSVERTVLNRLAHMMRGDRGRAVEIGNRARDLQNASVGSRAQTEPVDRKLEQALAAGLDLTVLTKIARTHLRVAEKRHPLEARELHLTRAVDALAYRERRLSRDAVRQVLVLHRRHFDMDVNSIEQRARDARAIALNRDRRA